MLLGNFVNLWRKKIYLFIAETNKIFLWKEPIPCIAHAGVRDNQYHGLYRCAWQLWQIKIQISTSFYEDSWNQEKSILDNSVVILQGHWAQIISNKISVEFIISVKIFVMWLADANAAF